MKQHVALTPRVQSGGLAGRAICAELMPVISTDSASIPHHLPDMQGRGELPLSFPGGSLRRSNRMNQFWSLPARVIGAAFGMC